MNSSREAGKGSLGRRALAALRARFSLREDKADDGDIDQGLRAGVEMKGTNLWVLMFAILIASIGLNVNSTAVIIGAMLISPLMGPLMGIGYGVGIYDFALIRRSLKNLGIATLLSLLTSAIYFALSPLTTVQSELLARTTPTIWDVLIAIFGGLAGIVAVTRKEKSTVIPGVAIATALMPPLCTAGFGLASGKWQFFLGAFYLFSINCVFIAASAAVIVRAYHVPHKRFVDERAAIRVRYYLFATVVLTVLPSLYLAYQLVEEEIFKARATQFVHRYLEQKQSHVVAVNIDPKTRRIEVTLVGDVVPKSALAAVASHLPDEGLGGSDLQVYQASDQKIDVAALKSNLLGDLYKDSQVALAEKDKTIAQMRGQIEAMNADRQRFSDIPAELHALYPQIAGVLLSEAPEWKVGTDWDKRTTVMLRLRATKPLSRSERRKIEDWLRARLKADAVEVSVSRAEN